MADQHPSADPNTSNASGGVSESSIKINIKTLDSQNHVFHVDKNIQVSALKEKVAAQTGVPVVQQRLIFRGKVLKDGHLLSEYHLENGDALHLVRELSQQQSSSGSNTTEATAPNGQDPTTGASRSRIGQISHSVMLGTFNVGDQGGGLVPDLSRVIGAVLNSVGIGSQIGGQHPGVQVTAPTFASQGNEAAEGIQNNPGARNQAGNQLPGQSLPQAMHIPLGATIPIPSLNLPIPDSLHTLVEFIKRMELVLSQNDNLQNQSPIDSSRVELPTNARGLPTPLALSTVLRLMEHLVGNHVVSALSRIGGRLEHESDSTDPTVRGQIRIESVQLGLAMQHLGALFLELGRTILTLRMGQSPADSSVNAGPAVYISPSGPNPIMVQPFPVQTNSLFSGFTSAPSNPGGFNPVGISSAPRNVNIHIHTAPIISAVGARAANGDATPGERANRSGSGGSSQSGGVPEINSFATDVPATDTVTSLPGAPQPGQSETATIEEPPVSSGCESRRTEESQIQVQSQQIPEGPSSSLAGSSQGIDGSSSSLPEPLGLGMGGLQLKKKIKQSQGKGGNSAATPCANSLPSVRFSHSARETLESTNSRGNDQSGIANAMSQVLQSPALNGLLSGVSQQTGVGSPDVFRNMLQQFTQSPAMMNAVSQMAQQIDTQDHGSMFAGLGAGQGGGVDFSNMLQQMMPLVSQALGGVSTATQQAPLMEVGANEGGARRETIQTAENAQSGLQEVAQRIERNNSPVEIFRGVVESVARGHHNGSLVNHLCNTEGLANEFMEVLRRDISQRLQDKTGKDH
ncbi:PREDICTED: large proline-rich protein BAG6-like isoform X2 [Ipomoea nil]|uniref:large proline-rich protein BAG6-like isoform X2 n=1 Tax=Ipomoea nil TaxID=35883 RepID=UPI00090153EF|nr:PREDICTED: large proline-rich protein BAG6-like isoform X2 [Ipomoea nil]